MQVTCGSRFVTAMFSESHDFASSELPQSSSLRTSEMEVASMQQSGGTEGSQVAVWRRKLVGMKELRRDDGESSLAFAVN